MKEEQVVYFVSHGLVTGIVVVSLNAALIIGLLALAWLS